MQSKEIYIRFRLIMRLYPKEVDLHNLCRNRMSKVTN